MASHPSYPQKYQNDYSPEALRSCGYALRNYLTLLQYAEVIEILKADSSIQSNPKSKIQNLTASGAALVSKAPRSASSDRGSPPGRHGGRSSIRRRSGSGRRNHSGGEGFYEMSRPLEIKTDRVALRGASGRRERVILEGGNRGELPANHGLHWGDGRGSDRPECAVEPASTINSETGVQKSHHL